jgi:hypothetical protein
MAEESDYTKGYDIGFDEALSYGEARGLEVMAKHAARLWGKPDAGPENALAGALAELFPDLDSLNIRVHVYRILKDYYEQH